MYVISVFSGHLEKIKRNRSFCFNHVCYLTYCTCDVIISTCNYKIISKLFTLNFPCEAFEIGLVFLTSNPPQFGYGNFTGNLYLDFIKFIVQVVPHTLKSLPVTELSIHFKFKLVQIK